jgi:hypothetical protein
MLFGKSLRQVDFILKNAKCQKGLSEREEKSGGCHLKKLVMSSFRKNQ